MHYRLKGVSIQLHIRLGNPIFFSLMRRNCLELLAYVIMLAVFERLSMRGSFVNLHVTLMNIFIEYRILFTNIFNWTNCRTISGLK